MSSLGEIDIVGIGPNRMMGTVLTGANWRTGADPEVLTATVAATSAPTLIAAALDEPLNTTADFGA
ncbi:unannotated protein [freshwater metagenome]|uniref:Unannotated protein n=1 Tax=freshwater metagenome TaxID=449393 RepID=A0A6J7ER34_9ZZZZ